MSNIPLSVELAGGQTEPTVDVEAQQRALSSAQISRVHRVALAAVMQKQVLNLVPKQHRMLPKPVMGYGCLTR